MRLIKIESPEEIWYFTSNTEMCAYLGCVYNTGDKSIDRGYYKQYRIEIINSDNILTKYINPADKGLKAKIKQ